MSRYESSVLDLPCVASCDQARQIEFSLPTSQHTPCAHTPCALTQGPDATQGFGWDACEKGGWWNIVKEKIPNIASAGFTHVWLPPPSESVAPQVRQNS